MTSIELLTPEELDRYGCDDDELGFGALHTPQGNLPLKVMDVRAHVVGLLAQTEVRQTYVNTLGTPLEATYIFPLPDRAAVSAFRFQVGERVVEGILKERGEARQQYDQAIQQGHRAAITEEERPGVFTMRVGNLMPGEEASASLTLSGPLPYLDGEVTFRFPLVVAPRYIPGTPLPGDAVGDGVAVDTDAVPDASRISPPMLLPGYPNPVRLSLSVELDPAGLPLGRVRSSLHAVAQNVDTAGRYRIALHPGERLDRDFVLRYEVGSAVLSSSLALQPDADGNNDEGTFQLTVVPPLGRGQGFRARDVVFVLDRSGSMSGWKMVAARRATARMLDTLNTHDRFSVLAFDDRIETPSGLGSAFVRATNRNRCRAIAWLDELEARGGTEMARPLQEAADHLRGGGERDCVLILVTDGQVGNEDQILRTLGKRLDGVRVFTLGIDRAVNAGFLQRLANLGGGFCELVESETALDEVMDKIHRRIGTPLLTGLQLKAEGIDVLPESLVPARLPDLFSGAPLRIMGRYRDRGGSARLRLEGTDAVSRPWVEVLDGRALEGTIVRRVWARGQVRELEDRYAIEASPDLARRITDTSLRHGVLCRFTAFVAIDRGEVVNEGGHVHRVTQAVEQPDGWAAGAIGGAVSGGLMPRAARARALPAEIDIDADLGIPDLSADLNRPSLLAPEPVASSPAMLRPAKRRVRDLLVLLKARHPALVARLRALAMRLETLIEDLRSAGYDQQAIQPFERLLRDLEVARHPATATLDEAEAARLKAKAHAVLEAFLSNHTAPRAEPAQPPARRRRWAFWR